MATTTHVVLLLLVSSLLCNGQASTSPCNISSNEEGIKITVDCTDRKLVTLRPAWFPAATTDLHLDGNPLGVLRAGTLAHLTQLQTLSLSRCGLHTIEFNAFLGLGKLIKLILTSNSLHFLHQNSTGADVFDNTPNITQLQIDDNVASTNSFSIATAGSDSLVNYTRLFIKLPKLESLHIDASPILLVGSEIKNLRCLTMLKIYCKNIIDISNSSLEELRDMLSLETIVIRGGNQYVDLHLGVFEPVSNLSNLHFNHMATGNIPFLKSLWPFENKTMRSIVATNIGLRHNLATPVGRLTDGALTNDILSSLLRIRLSTFIYDYNDVFSWGTDIANHNTLFGKTLKVLKVTGNYEQFADEWRIVLFKMFTLPSLEDVALAGYIPYSSNGAYLQTQSSTMCTLHPKSISTTAQWDGQEHETRKTSLNNRTDLSKSWAIIYLTENIKRIAWSSHGGGKIEVIDMIVKHGQNMREAHINGAGHIEINGNIIGLSSLCLLDISGSKLIFTNKVDLFLDTPNLTVLKMNSLVNGVYVVNSLVRLKWLERLPYLTVLELANSDLNLFSYRNMKQNIYLTETDFSGNKLSDLPFNIEDTPQLLTLNLKDNAILYLETVTMAALDEHSRRQHDFRLHLQGNHLSCGCTRIKYITWILTTLVHLDSPAKYTCTDDTGTVRTLGDLSTPRAIWRQCVGSLALAISMALALCIVIGFLMTYIGIRFKSAVQAWVLRTMTRGLGVRSRHDYSNHVFVGYTSDDIRFVRGVLLRYIEEDLGVTSTFMHDRDMRGGSFEVQVADAVHDTWRHVLVLSRSFLRSYDKAHHIMKQCAEAASPLNPGSLLVLVEEGQERYIEDYLWALVDETHVVRVGDMRAGSLTYEQREQIKHFVRS